jgi:hypothetical protein
MHELERRKTRERTAADDWLAASLWARVLHAFVVDGEERALALLPEARDHNPHVEQYLTGRKRLPRTRAGMYSPGDETEAQYCAEILGEAWKKHPEARKWLKEATGSGVTLQPFAVGGDGSGGSWPVAA